MYSMERFDKKRHEKNQKKIDVTRSKKNWGGGGRKEENHFFCLLFEKMKKMEKEKKTRTKKRRKTGSIKRKATIRFFRKSKGKQINPISGNEEENIFTFFFSSFSFGGSKKRLNWKEKAGRSVSSFSFPPPRFFPLSLSPLPFFSCSRPSFFVAASRKS